MNKKEFNKNVRYLEDNDIRFLGRAWDDEKFSAELETYTNAGEDMVFTLHELSKQSLQEYIDNFDINEEVMIWWRDGEDAAHEAGVPFTNIRDHYCDYEDFLDTLQEVCDNMPY